MKEILHCSLSELSAPYDKPLEVSSDCPLVRMPKIKLAEVTHIKF